MPPVYCITSTLSFLSVVNKHLPSVSPHISLWREIFMKCLAYLRSSTSSSPLSLTILIMSIPFYSESTRRKDSLSLNVWLSLGNPARFTMQLLPKSISIAQLEKSQIFCNTLQKGSFAIYFTKNRNICTAVPGLSLVLATNKGAKWLGLPDIQQDK